MSGKACDPLGRVLGPRAVAPTKGRRDEPFDARLAFCATGPHEIVGTTSPVDKLRPTADFAERLELVYREDLSVVAELDRGGGDAPGGLASDVPHPSERAREERTC